MPAVRPASGEASMLRYEIDLVPWMHMVADLNSEKDNPLHYQYMALVIKGTPGTWKYAFQTQTSIESEISFNALNQNYACNLG